ncbi:MAG: hypothetical protein ACXAD7_28170 [Candidatus Kariarchaeaceae archaeon]|jgi:hypothetical protein
MPEYIFVVDNDIVDDHQSTEKLEDEHMIEQCMEIYDSEGFSFSDDLEIEVYKKIATCKVNAVLKKEKK